MINSSVKNALVVCASAGLAVLSLGSVAGAAGSSASHRTGIYVPKPGTSKTTHSSVHAASTTPPVPQAITGWDYGGIWAGNYRLDTGPFPVYCIKAFGWYPAGQYSGAISMPGGTTAAQMGYIINKWGTSADPDTQAAVAAVAGLNYDEVDTNEKWAVLTPHQQQLAFLMSVGAQDQAGPYSITFSFPALIQQNVNYVATVHVTAASGKPASGIGLLLGATGANIAINSVTTDSSGQATYVFAVPGSNASGSFTLSALGSQVVGVSKYSPVGAGGSQRQDVLGGAAPTLMTGSRTGSYATDRPGVVIKFKTGDASHTPIAGATYDLEKANGHVISTIVTAATPVALGNLTEGVSYKLVEKTAPSGYYVPADNVKAFTVPVGSGQFEVKASDPETPTPAITTAVVTPNMPLGESLKDSVTVTGNDGEAGVITGTVHGPVATPVSGLCSDVTAGQWSTAATAVVTKDITTNGTFILVGPKAVAGGCYAWSQSLVLNPSGATAVSAATDAGEATLVTGPTIITHASANSVTPGTKVHDTVDISGMGALTGTMTGQLLGPVAPTGGSCSSVDWTGAHVQGSFPGVAVNSDGTYVSADIATGGVGCYTFQEHLVMSAGPAIDTTPGEVAETVVASVPAPPTTTTTAPPATTSTTSPSKPGATPTTGPKSINTGEGASARWQGGLWVALGGLVLAAGIGLLAVRRKR